MINILVPTDFSIQSLDIVNDIVKNQQETIRIYLLHMVEMPSDISELIFLRKKHLARQVPTEFTEAMQALKLKYGTKITDIELKLHYGSRTAVFNGIMDSLRIDEICILEDYTYKRPMEDSVDMMRMINRSEIPVYKIETRNKARRVGEARVISTFGIAEPYTSLT